MRKSLQHSEDVRPLSYTESLKISPLSCYALSACANKRVYYWLDTHDPVRRIFEISVVVRVFVSN